MVAAYDSRVGLPPADLPVRPPAEPAVPPGAHSPQHHLQPTPTPAPRPAQDRTEATPRGRPGGLPTAPTLLPHPAQDWTEATPPGRPGGPPTPAPSLLSTPAAGPAAQPPAPPKRLPARSSLFGLRIGQVLGWQAAAVAVLAVATSRPLLLRAAVGGAAAVVCFTLVRWRGQWLYQRVGRRLGFAVRRRTARRSAAQALPGLSDLLPELDVSTVAGRRGQQIGLVRDGRGWAVLVEVSAGDDVFPARGAPTTLPVSRLAELLSIDDIRLAGVQLVVHAVPPPPEAWVGPAARPLPAAQGIWVVLRLDPMVAPEALISRGGGVEALHRALRRCTERAAETLAATGLSAKPLDEAAVRSALALSAAPPTAAGAPPAVGVERWGHWECGAAHVGYEVCRWPPDRLATLLEAVLAAPVLAVVVAVTFHGVDSRSARITGTVRLVAADPHSAREAGRALQKAVASQGGRLARLDGRHAAAVVATLPVGGGPR